MVVVILDEFPTDDLLGPDSRIDAERFPNFAELASISTWFPNAYTVYDSTFKAVPDILDAQLRSAAPPRTCAATNQRLPPGEPSRIRDPQGRVGHGGLSTAHLRRGARTPPGVLDRLKGGGRPRPPAQVDREFGRVRSQRSTCTTRCCRTSPGSTCLRGVRTAPSARIRSRGINSKASFSDARLTQHNHMRHLLQVGYTDPRARPRLLDRLRRTGLRRRAALAVVADHGYAFDIGVESRRLVSEATIDEVGPVPFFLKAPGQMQGEVDESLVRNIDLVPSIAEQLGTRLWWRHDGRSVGGAPETRARDGMAIRTRDLRQVIRIGRDELEARRRANRLRWARLFGTGAQSRLLFRDPWASVYRIGPHRALLDRRVAALDVRRPPEAATGDSVRAVMANAALLRNVSERRADRASPDNRAARGGRASGFGLWPSR